jgi:acylphosphatase
MSSVVSLHAIVHGTVQGVSFRHYARQEALRLDLTGWVRNLPDRTVETLAVGTRANLETYCEWLHHGPSQARVTQVAVTWSDAPPQTFETFEIIYVNRD